ncbi:hypothetical protein [Saccharopolyspora phatthalungensis]|nr:hypothetical protein [Saccharopolyspora phatthalungensis]
MKQAVCYVGVWLTATTAAVTLAWLGVRDVIRGAVFEQPDAVPLVRPVPLPPTESPLPPPTSNAPAPPPSDTVDSPTSETEPDPPSSTPSSTPPSEEAGEVRTYDVKGGKVVLSLRPDGADLVSAVPRSGYTVQTWDQVAGWLRVEFTAGQHGSSVIATWHDHPTQVETQEY